jgi:hypothetical protein
MAKIKYDQFEKLTIEDALERLKLSPSDCTVNTYIYVDNTTDLCAIEKPNRHSEPDDELWSFGYVSAFADIGKLKTVIKSIRVNEGWWDELGKRVPNVSAFIRQAVNEKLEREGQTPLSGWVGERGVRHDYMGRKVE